MKVLLIRLSSVLLLFCLSDYGLCFQYKYEEDPGEPLILTPYLAKGQMEKARELAVVPEELFLRIKSYSGFFTVDEVNGSNSFFWFIPATDVDYTDAPVLLWLQGGPGGRSILSAFLENGPFRIVDDTHIILSNISWTSSHSVLYIDNPVGTGFSFTNGGWRTSEEEIGEDIYIALIQFFQLFPELRKNDFFIAGESYAGKYVPAVSYTIHKKNPKAELQINLKGLAIGNGLSDTINQLNYGDYLFQNGLIDFNARNIMNSYEEQIVDMIEDKNYDAAFILYDELLLAVFTKYPTFFKNATGFDSYYNYLLTEDVVDVRNLTAFIQNSTTRKALHVGNVSFYTDPEVLSSLKADFMISVAPWISELLSHYRVLIYNGQLDIIVPYVMTVNYLRKLDFSAAEEYETAARYEWKVNGTIAGYSKQAGNLTEVLVRNAGHTVIIDQPTWALDLIYKFVRNIPLH